jgi:hypothetical protein
MEVPENIYNWLQKTELFNLPPDQGANKIPQEIMSSLESGHGFSKIIKRLNQLKVQSK